jgi:phthalate 3,4-cis-dihydrodiol dehydrogenase
MGLLDDKVGFAVGGGSGIGRAVVEEFAREGACVGVLELSEEKCEDLEDLAPDVIAIQGDARSVQDTERAVEKTIATFGRLDTLAVFVGVFDWYVPLRDIPIDRLHLAFEETFTTNVESYLIATKVALPALLEGQGNIIFTISTSGFYPGRGGPLYVASKFALRGLVVQLAHELAPDLRVNGVAPGGTLNTDLRGLHSIGLQDRRLDDLPGRDNDLQSRSPLGVALTADDHAGAYAFLASDRARGITGMIVNSDGGVGVRG